MNKIVTAAFRKYMNGKAYKLLSLGNGLIVARVEGKVEKYIYNDSFAKEQFQEAAIPVPLNVAGWKIKLGREEAERQVLPWRRWSPDLTTVCHLNVMPRKASDPVNLIRVNADGKCEEYYYTLPEEVEIKSLEEIQAAEKAAAKKAKATTETPEEQAPEANKAPKFDAAIWFRRHAMAFMHFMMNQMDNRITTATMDWKLVGGMLPEDCRPAAQKLIFRNSQIMFPIEAVQILDEGILITMSNDDDSIPEEIFGE